MTAENQKMSAADHDAIIDRIYDVALDPTLFDDFVTYWFESGFGDKWDADSTFTVEDFDAIYGKHLQRAQTILDRSEDQAPCLQDQVAAHPNFAAFVVGSDLRIEAANQGASEGLGLRRGGTLQSINLSTRAGRDLSDQVAALLNGPKSAERLLRVGSDAEDDAYLLRLRPIPGKGAVLVVSTKLHWDDHLSDLLEQTYDLTAAEQQVVRRRVMGMDIKQIAGERGTSEGTVRVQIKSIMGKMGTASQADLVRTAMSLASLPRQGGGDAAPTVVSVPSLSNDWLEKEVWKPFKSTTLPDGRTLTYHEMGPPTGKPVLFSHMGSCMIRWSHSMLRLAFQHDLRVICPIRAGYGHSDRLSLSADPIAAARADCEHLLAELGISRLPYVVQGTDIPLGFDLAAHRPDLVSDLIALGGKPCLPCGSQIDGTGFWQRIALTAARKSPHMMLFVARTIMAMSRRMGSEMMLRQLCKDSPADLALLENAEIHAVLIANIEMMSGKRTNAAQGFAMEYVAFQDDWSALVTAARAVPTRIVLADQDPTTHLNALPDYHAAYPWITFEVEENTGLALFYQRPEKFVGLMAGCARI